MTNMKRLPVFLVSSLMFLGFQLRPVVVKASGSASAPCAVCIELQRIEQRLRKADEGAIDDARDKLQKVHFSKEEALRAREVLAYANMAVWAILKDDEGDSDSYFYNAYIENRTAFDKAIAQMPKKSQLILEKSLRETGQVLRKGNG